MTTLFPELPGQSVPRSGRRGRPRRVRPAREPGACLVCGGELGPHAQVACSPQHRGLISAWKQLRPGEPFDREAMAIISEGRRMRRTIRSRRRSLRRALTWDGITDLEIFERDGWRCQVPECLYRYRTINRRYKYPDPRSAGIDHIVPLSLGGDDTAVNKRAAHHGCNMARGNRMGDEQLPLIGSIREPPLRTEIAGTVRERRKPMPKPQKMPKMRRCPCGTDFPSAQTGKNNRLCRDCLIDLGTRAAKLRAACYSWNAIIAELGYWSTAGSLYGIAQRYGGLSFTSGQVKQRLIPPTWTAKARAAAARLEAGDAA